MQDSFIFAILHPGFLGDFVALTPGVTYSEKPDPQFPDFSDFYQCLGTAEFGLLFFLGLIPTFGAGKAKKSQYQSKFRQKYFKSFSLAGTNEIR